MKLLDLNPKNIPILPSESSSVTSAAEPSDHAAFSGMINSEPNVIYVNDDGNIQCGHYPNDTPPTPCEEPPVTIPLELEPNVIYRNEDGEIQCGHYPD